jgi:hypothetical protein
MMGGQAVFMDNPQSDPGDPASAPARAAWSGRTKRVGTSVAASAVLLGSGAAIGMALTGGASASTGTPTAGASATAKAGAGPAGARCARLVRRLRATGHPAAGARLRAFCGSPLLRLAVVGGEHGEMTFQGKAGPKTIAVERGTVTSVTGSAIVVAAPDGTSWTWDFTASTVVREAGQPVARARLAAGDLVLVGGPVVTGVRDARLIRIRSAG